MTKQKHFYLIRGLIREKGHWGQFLDEMKMTFPDAVISTIDIPGAGEYFNSPSPLSISQMVEQMRRDYLKLKLDDENSHLIAISLGGMIAVEWLQKHPGDFHRATLINTSFGGISPLFKRLLPDALLFLLKVPTLKGRQKESRILKVVSNNPEVFEATLDLWEEIQKKRPVSLPNTLRQLMAGALYRVGDWSPHLPITILASTQDRMVSVDCSREIARKWNLKIIEHPTAGHDLSADDPKWLAEKIKANS